MKKTQRVFVLAILVAAIASACSDEKTSRLLKEEDEIPPHLRISYPAQTRIIAHRGYWNTKGAAENSLAALDKAAEAGFYGSEFDVRFTSDGVPVIHHDPQIHEITIENTSYNRIKNIKLSNGETLPTLRQYLNRGKGRNIRLILEIKSEDIAVAAPVVAMVEETDMQAQVEYISFHLPMCREILRLAPQASVSYLGGNIAPAELKALGFAGIDYASAILNRKPEWIPEAKALGMTVNVWVVNDLQMMYDFIRRDVDFITTDKPTTLKRMLEQ
ncbi:MAG: glycerophosphodiester phosphodiesterase [Tannerella sp.]|jgi:glycerophosphoryl diester phosphodiesterase|nr:glycerophosphodiester phosphodiesterase [Tannerella sp.]